MKIFVWWVGGREGQSLLGKIFPGRKGRGGANFWLVGGLRNVVFFIFRMVLGFCSNTDFSQLYML